MFRKLGQIPSVLVIKKIDFEYEENWNSAEKMHHKLKKMAMEKDVARSRRMRKDDYIWSKAMVGQV